MPQGGKKCPPVWSVFKSPGKIRLMWKYYVNFHIWIHKITSQNTSTKLIASEPFKLLCLDSTFHKLADDNCKLVDG